MWDIDVRHCIEISTIPHIHIPCTAYRLSLTAEGTPPIGGNIFSNHHLPSWCWANLQPAGVTFDSVQRTSCNRFLLPAARLLATVFLSSSMLHVNLWHQLTSFNIKLPFLWSSHQLRTFQAMQQEMPRDAKRCQASAGEDLDEFPCELASLASCAGPLAIASSFHRDHGQKMAKMVNHSVPFQNSTQCFWLIVTGWLTQKTCWIPRVSRYLSIIDIYILIILNNIMANTQLCYEPNAFPS